MTSTPHTLVLGAGIVGTAAAWDLARRGHEVTIADANVPAAAAAADEFGLDHEQIDVGDIAAVEEAMERHDAVIAAVPYSYGPGLAAAAATARCHYFDFGGNPTIVKEQLRLNARAIANDVAVVPDCGLAPGVANVLAAGLIADAPSEVVESVQIHVGCLPQEPRGALRYQLAFYPGGLINEYAEPCEIVAGGTTTTVEPLTRFEQVEWDRWGPLEAFSTAGGTSTMCQVYEGTVQELEYKTLRYPGHGSVFQAMRELGLFDTQARRVKGVEIAPRSLLLDLLAKRLPSGSPDVVLVRVTVAAGGSKASLQMEDFHDGRFSALARTTAFPATALCDLVLRGDIRFRGAAAMHTVADPDRLMRELTQVGVVAVPL
ncbi:MAG: FAD-dependent oxidoreductase [Actinomycetota bacterium]|nr:FAD-dependent oxidoreductase [Actinomycetota bacterium]